MWTRAPVSKQIRRVKGNGNQSKSTQSLHLGLWSSYPRSATSTHRPLLQLYHESRICVSALAESTFPQSCACLDLVTAYNFCTPSEGLFHAFHHCAQQATAHTFTWIKILVSTQRKPRNTQETGRYTSRTRAAVKVAARRTRWVVF